MDIIIRNGVLKQESDVKTDIYKKDYKDFDESIPGPYYDLTDTHLHQYKRVSLIKNFKGEQNPKQKKLQTHSMLPTKGEFCTICHKKYRFTRYNLSKDEIVTGEVYKKRTRETDELSTQFDRLKLKKNSELLWDRFFYMIVKNRVEKVRKVYIEYLIIIQKMKKIINNWERFVTKLTAEPIYYPISSLKTIILKEWELTPFQRTKLEVPNYQQECSFIIRKTENYSSNYFMVENP